MPQDILDYEQGKDKFSQAIAIARELASLDAFEDEANSVEEDLAQLLASKKEADYEATNTHYGRITNQNK